MKKIGKTTRITGRQLTDILRREIVEHSVSPGIQLPTSRELALRFRVSAKTVDRALRNLAQRGMVERVPGRGTFVKNNRPEIARNRIAVIYLYHNTPLEPELHYAAYEYFEAKLIESLESGGYHADLIRVNRDEFKLGILPAVNFRKYDVIISTCHDEAWRDLLLNNSPVPVIFSNDEVSRPGAFHQAYYDFLPGFRSLWEAALKSHFHRFVVITCAEHNCDRLQSLMDSARKMNIPASGIRTFSHRAKLIDSPMLAGIKGADYIMKNNLLDHLIITPSDFIACGLLEEFANHGLTAGKDYFLISYDNTESRSLSLKMGLTSITHPLEAMIEALVRIVENLLRCPNGGKYYCSYQVPANELVFRRSFPDPDTKYVQSKTNSRNNQPIEETKK